MAKHNWKKIKTEYVTGSMSLDALCDKYGCAKSVIGKHCREEKWVEARNNHRTRVSTKAVEKICNRQADQFTEELYLLGKLEEVVKKLLEDSEQFNRHIVQTTEYDNQSRTTTTTIGEKVLNKVDTRALKDTADTLKQLESMKRSMKGILTEQQIEQLEQGREKLRLERQKTEQSEVDKEVVVKIEGYNKEWTE